MMCMLFAQSLLQLFQMSGQPKKKQKVESPAFVMQDDLVAAAKEFVKSGKVISFAEAQKLWESACDGPGVTNNVQYTHAYTSHAYTHTRRHTRAHTHTRKRTHTYSHLPTQEFKTLEHILATYTFTDKAKRYLSPLATKQASGKSAYKTVNKVKMDRSCLDLGVLITNTDMLLSALQKVTTT